MQRRVGGQYSRGSSPAENGHSHPAGGQLCPGGSACLNSGNGLICGCIKKASPLRRAINTLRIRARRGASGGQKGALGAYLAAFVFFVWCGLQASALLRGGGGVGGVPQPTQQRELAVAATTTTTTSGGDKAPVGVAGYGEQDVGPRIAYGIMVYQRVGYSPQMTLDQFARMFNALYDEENT